MSKQLNYGKAKMKNKVFSDYREDTYKTKHINPNVYSSKMNVQESIEGTIREVFPTQYSRIYRIAVSDKQVVDLVGCTLLDQMMAGVKQGDRVKVTCVEKKVSKEKRIYNKFDVIRPDKVSLSRQSVKKRVTFADIMEIYCLDFKNDSRFVTKCKDDKESYKFSIQIFEDTQLFKCHRCDVKGDIFNFIDHLGLEEGPLNNFLIDIDSNILNALEKKKEDA